MIINSIVTRAPLLFASCLMLSGYMSGQYGRHRFCYQSVASRSRMDVGSDLGIAHVGERTDIRNTDRKHVVWRRQR